MSLSTYGSFLVGAGVVLGRYGASVAHRSALAAESSESKPDAFKGAYTVDESKWEMPEELKAKYA